MKKGVILIIIIALIITSCTGNLNLNNNNDNNKKPVNNELKDVYAFAIINESLTALKKDGQQVIIYNIGNAFSIDFAVTGSKLYINSFEDEFWGVIDLNKGDGIYELVKFSEIEYDFLAGITFAAIGDYIYYDDNRYNTKNNTHESILNVSGHRTDMKFHDKENLLFYYGGTQSDIYMYDIKNKQETKIVDDGTIEFVYKDKLIYTLDKKNIRTYYEYDVKTGKSTEITSGTAWGGSSAGSSIVPHSGGYILIDHDKLYNSNLYKIDSNRNKEFIYSYGEGVSLVINLLSPDKIITITEQMNDEPECLIFDINKKTIENGDYNSFKYIQYVSFE